MVHLWMFFLLIYGIGKHNSWVKGVQVFMAHYFWIHHILFHLEIKLKCHWALSVAICPKFKWYHEKFDMSDSCSANTRIQQFSNSVLCFFFQRKEEKHK